MKSRNGYIALSAVLVITAFLLIVAVAIGVASFLGRSSLSGNYYKEVSRSLAESCVQKALLALANNAAYAGGETFTIATSTGTADTCDVVSVADSGAYKVIRARGVFQGASSNIEATADVSSTLSIVGWQELPGF